MMRNSSAMYDRRYGHLLKGMIEILSRGYRELEAFILRTVLVVCLNNGGDRSYGMDGSASGGIQLGILKAFAGLMERKKLRK